jgi:hypothetical protein
MRRREDLRVLRDFPCESLHRRTCKQRCLYSLCALFLSTSGLLPFGTDFYVIEIARFIACSCWASEKTSAPTGALICLAFLAIEVRINLNPIEQVFAKLKPHLATTTGHAQVACVA